MPDSTDYVPPSPLFLPLPPLSFPFAHLTDQNGFCKCPAPISMRCLLPALRQERLWRGVRGNWGGILVTGAHDLLKCALAGGNGLCSSSSSPSPRLDSPRCHFGQRIWLCPKMEVELVLGAAAPWVMLVVDAAQVAEAFKFNRRIFYAFPFPF